MELVENIMRFYRLNRPIIGHLPLYSDGWSMAGIDSLIQLRYAFCLTKGWVRTDIVGAIGRFVGGKIANRTETHKVRSSVG